MRIDHIAEAAIGHVFGRLMRQALLAAIFAVCVIVALYHATIAGFIALDGQYGALDARLIVAAIYAVVGLVSLAVFWQQHRAARLPMNAKALASTREMQVVMLIEAVMLGFQLARKGERR